MEILMSLLFICAIGFIIICIIGAILKHFIREAIKEALTECGLSKRETDTTW